MPEFIFERWGSLRPEWKMNPNGKYFMPLFAGIWVSIPEPNRGAKHCNHGYNGSCPVCDATEIKKESVKCDCGNPGA